MQNEVKVGSWVAQPDSGWSVEVQRFLWVQGWPDRSAEFSAFYLVGIVMECVNWLLGSRHLAKCLS